MRPALPGTTCVPRCPARTHVHGHACASHRFLSAFKWEPRKGWDVLLEAYVQGEVRSASSMIV